ncbi:DUF6368 family protein [Streptomyces sp. NPDC101194]|uniref:DUF6368 family protein n=1 Tax=Streptomyces sp. NPDC101194 TaxID=3366127 RepID=UPI0037F34A18
MGGPAVGLWLPEERSALDAVPWLGSFCQVQTSDGCLEFRVREPSALGLYGLGNLSSGPFHLGLDSLDDFQELGFPGIDRPPVAELALVAYCSSQDDHLLLGHLALFLAERFNALINFYGLLGYGSFHDLSEEEGPARLIEARALVTSLPGRVWETQYATYGGGHSYSHIGDREFLVAWLRHPEFRMIREIKP